MRIVAIALYSLALSATTATTANAGGQNKLQDPKTAVEQVFWPQLYGAGGTSLYCGKTFNSEGGQFVASPVYPTKQIKSSLRCITDKQCAEKNSQYPFMLADLHNLYPELARVELARRNSLFGALGDAVPSKFGDIDCDLKASFQLVEPRNEAKGNVARALFYMHVEYDLPIPGQVQMFKQWHQMDPPDAEEKARNDRIAELQGTRNRFIDNPELVDQQISN